VQTAHQKYGVKLTMIKRVTFRMDHIELGIKAIPSNTALMMVVSRSTFKAFQVIL
jgi:hypothetical protein